MVRVGNTYKEQLQVLAKLESTSMTKVIESLIQREHYSKVEAPQFKELDSKCIGEYKVYKLTFTSGKVYIGATNSIHKRVNQHISSNRFYEDKLVQVEVLHEHSDKYIISSLEREEIIKVLGDTCYNSETYTPFATNRSKGKSAIAMNLEQRLIVESTQRDAFTLGDLIVNLINTKDYHVQ